MSRTKNVIRNIRWGIVHRAISILLPFVVRTVLIYSLSAAYAGLNGLFSSVLSILSLAELGISKAITFSMYKPVSEGDVDKVCALLNVYRKAYRIIGGVIMVIGFILMPFLGFLIHGDIPADINLYLLFGIYLFNTVISYFMYGYKSCILSVNQREDILSKASISTNILLHVIQCALLIVFKNYYCFIIVVPLFTIMQNLLNNYWANKIFPQYKPRGSVDEEEYADLKKRIAGLMIWKVGNATRNTFDSIVISAYIGLVTVAMYNNYWMIITAVNGVLGVISSSMLASVGNKMATDTPEENYKDFHKFHFIYMWISGWCAICMLCLFQPFMKQWMGEELMFPFEIVILFCYLFFKMKEGDINYVYYQAAGLWWEGKWRSIIEAASNLVLNLILGKFFGVTGVLLATVISYNIAYYYGSRFTFVCYFKNNKTERYLIENLIYLSVSAVAGYVTYLITSHIAMESRMAGSIICLLICLIIPNIFYLSIYSLNSKTKGYIIYGKRSLLKMVGKKYE